MFKYEIFGVLDLKINYNLVQIGDLLFCILAIKQNLI